jgi:sugar phosphate isomerase/epimerase
MKVLTNLTTLDYHMDWFDKDWEKIEEFINRNKLNGLELMVLKGYDQKNIPKDTVVGMHMGYWSMWLDFWRGDKDALIEQFGSEENIISFYGGLDKNILIDHYKYEIETAKNIGVEYAVFHVTHAEILHTYNFEFTYSDWDILEAAAELVNESFGSEDEGFTLLFENLWCPGLKLTNANLVKKFLDKINYPNKGIMLDIGHLMITNPNIINEEEACKYILSVVNNLGDLKKYIKGIHLNKALSGDYLREDHSEKIKVLQNITDFWDKLEYSGRHIKNIDLHVPFDSPFIKEVIDEIKPEYLVFEVIGKNLEELENMLKTQRKIF